MGRERCRNIASSNPTELFCFGISSVLLCSSLILSSVGSNLPLNPSTEYLISVTIILFHLLFKDICLFIFCLLICSIVSLNISRDYILLILIWSLGVYKKLFLLTLIWCLFSCIGIWGRGESPTWLNLICGKPEGLNCGSFQRICFCQEPWNSPT